MDWWKERLQKASALVALLGLVFILGGVTIWYVELVSKTETIHQAVYELVMHVLFGGVILILGIHIERSELSPDEKFSVIVWCYGGFTVMFALSAWGHLDAILGGDLPVAFISDFVVFTSLGGAFGAIAGVNWGRATKNRLLAERNEKQRETLALLARLVSHDIRNDMGVISGYADILTEHVDGEGTSYLEVIRRRVDNSTQLLEDTSSLVKSLDEDRDLESINLSSVLEQEVATLREDHPDVTVESDMLPDITVEADSLLHQLFKNLLQNAAVHNDIAGLTIRVRAEQTETGAEVVISDNGSGIPPEIRDTCFELGEHGSGSGGDGIGLYLVSRLMEIYGGNVELDESPDGGARFRLAFSTPSSE